MATRRADTYGLLCQNRAQLSSAIEGLTPSQMAVAVINDWSIKDILTHITSWEELVLLDLNRLKRGHTPTLAAFPQEATEKWNNLLMCVRRALPLDQVVIEFRETRDAIVSALDELPDEAFVSGYVPGTCQITAFHDWEHTRDIRAWREREGI